MAETMKAGSRQQGRIDSNTTVSCDVCRRKKSKCDMARPSCGSCKRHHWTCGYTALRKKPGPRQGSRQASTLAVQRRLDILEELLDSSTQEEAAGDYVSPTPPPAIRENGRPRTRTAPPASENQSFPVDPETLYSATAQLHPLTASLKWFSQGEPDPSSSENDRIPSFCPGITASDIMISSDSEHQLISHFFTDVKLPVSVLCKEKLYRDYDAKVVPTFLLNAMFSLSARFFQRPELLGIKDVSPENIGSYFSSKARAEMDLVGGRGDIVAVVEVTAAYLLAYHDFTNTPSRQAAEQCSKAVHMAYKAGLHQVDNTRFPRHTTYHVTEIELEERRCLWWGIFTLDTFSSLTSFLPPNIEDLSIASCLPTTVISHTTLHHVFQTRRAYLDDDLECLWGAILELESGAARTQAVLIYVTAMAREMAAARRLNVENHRCDITTRLNALQQKWEKLLSSLPVWFFDPTPQCSENMGDDHRKRLETLIMIHTLGTLSTYPPLDLRFRWPMESYQTPMNLKDRWKGCMFHAQRIAGVYRSWTPEYSQKADSLMLPMTWIATCLLMFHTMNTDDIDCDKRLATWDSIDTVMNCLHECSQYWGIARFLLYSLEGLRGKAWRKVDTTTIFRLLFTLSAPQIHYRSSLGATSGTTDATAVSSNHGIHDIDYAMAWPTLVPGLQDFGPLASLDWPGIVADNDILFGQQ